MRRRLSLLVSTATALAVLLVSTPASAAVSVTLRKSYLGTHSQLDTICPVSVADGSDGLAVLDAAVASGCISSYVAVTFSFGKYISCIDDLCETAATYWAMYENGAMTSFGVSDFVANAGDELEFSYTTWLPCATPAGCDPTPV